MCLAEGSVPATWYMDLMHTDYVGLAPHLFASALVDVMEEGHLGSGSPDDAKLRAWLFQVNEERRRTGGTKLKGSLSMSLLGRDSSICYPCLSSTIKAVTLKACMRHLAKQLQRYQATMHQKVRATCLWAWVEFHSVLERAGPILTTAEAEHAKRVGQLLLDTYQWLSKSAHDQGRSLYKIVCKHHYYCHIVDSIGASLNPKTTECMTDETFIGHFKQTAGKCHGASVCRTYLLRHVLYLAIRLKRRRDANAWRITR